MVLRDFLAEFRQFFRQYMLIGIVLGGAVSAIAALGAVYVCAEPPGLPELAVLALAALLSVIWFVFAVYCFVIMSSVKLSVCAVLKNALLLSLAALSRNLLLTAGIVAYGFACWYLFPVSAPFLLLIGMSLPWLIASMVTAAPVTRYITDPYEHKMLASNAAD